MNLTETQLIKLVTEALDYDLCDYDGVRIEDEDDLHDYIINLKIGGIFIEEYDYLYWQAVALLPHIIDEILNYIDGYVDYNGVIEEQWRVYYSQIAL
jgi:hypothetical protein